MNWWRISTNNRESGFLLEKGVERIEGRGWRIGKCGEKQIAYGVREIAKIHYALSSRNVGFATYPGSRTFLFTGYFSLSHPGLPQHLEDSVLRNDNTQHECFPLYVAPKAVLLCL
jgi:hypothetical protein